MASWRIARFLFSLRSFRRSRAFRSAGPSFSVDSSIDDITSMPSSTSLPESSTSAGGSPPAAGTEVCDLGSESLAADAPDAEAGVIGVLAIGSSSVVNDVGNRDDGSEGAEGLDDPSVLVVRKGLVSLSGLRDTRGGDLSLLLGGSISLVGARGGDLSLLLGGSISLDGRLYGRRSSSSSCRAGALFSREDLNPPSSVFCSLCSRSISDSRNRTFARSASLLLSSCSTATCASASVRRNSVSIGLMPSSWCSRWIRADA